MLKELCVIGHPSKLGGADTELDHQIRLWRHMGIDVYICHTGGFDDNLLIVKKEMLALGCKYLPECSWKDLSGFHTISFCNGQFLENIKEIKKYAKTTTFVNCMTWNFDKELDAHKKGLIDFFLYQTQHQFDKGSIKLKEISQTNYKPLFFSPYFDNKNFPFIERKNKDFFRFGRISRGDADKYGSRQLWIYETMTAPVLKQGIMLGWDHRAQKKLGDPPPYVKGLGEGYISQQEFYTQCDAIIMTTDTFENLPRVGFEAMSMGSVLVVDNRGGWKVLVKDSKTGWLCNDDREFVYKASRTAFETKETDKLRINARKSLEKDWGKESSSKTWEKVFNEWENYNK
jgi:glycosyltransferase involved in cell wall biosynthesis